MRPTRRSLPGAGHPRPDSGGALASASASTSASDVEPAPTLAPALTPASTPAPTKLSSRSIKLLRELHIDAKPSLGGASKNRKYTAATGSIAPPVRPEKTSYHAKSSSLSSELSSVPSDLPSSPPSIENPPPARMAKSVVGAQSPTKPTKAYQVSVPPTTSSPAMPLANPDSLAPSETPVKPDTTPAKKRTITDYFMSIPSKTMTLSPAKRSRLDNQESGTATTLSLPRLELQKTTASPLRPTKEEEPKLVPVKRSSSIPSLSKPDALSTPIKTAAMSTLATVRTPSLPGKIRTLSLTDEVTPLSQTSASSSRKSNVSVTGSSTKPKRQKGVVSRETQIKNWKRYGYTSSKHARQVLLNTDGLNDDQDPSALTSSNQPDDSAVDQKDDNEESELGQPDDDISSTREADEDDSSIQEDDGNASMPQVGNKVSMQEDEDVIMRDYDEIPVEPAGLRKSARRKNGHVRGETLIKNWTRYGLDSYEQAKSLAQTIPTGTEISIDELNKRRDSIAESRATSDVDGQTGNVKGYEDDNNEDGQDLDEAQDDGDDDQDNDDSDNDDSLANNDKDDEGGVVIGSQRRVFDRNEVIKAIKNPSKGIGSTGLSARTLISNWRRYGFKSAKECKEWLVSDEFKEGLTKPEDAAVPTRKPTTVMSAAEKKARELRRLQIDAKPNLLGSLATPEAISSRRELKRRPMDESPSKKTSNPFSALIDRANGVARKDKAEAIKSSSSKPSSKAADNGIMGPPPQPKMINVAINTPGARSSNPEDPEAPWVVVNPKWINPWFDWLADLVDEDDEDDDDDSDEDEDGSDGEEEVDSENEELDNPDEEMHDVDEEEVNDPDEEIDSTGEVDSNVSDSETVVPRDVPRQDPGGLRLSSKEGAAKKLQDLEVMEAWPLVASKARDKGKGKERRVASV